MPSAAMRAALGFVAAALSVLTFQQAMWGLLHALALPGLTMPMPYPTDPVIPYGLPRTLNDCLLGGLCGAVFGLAAPRLAGPLWLWGLAMGLLVALAGLVVVPMVKHYQIGARWMSLRAYTTMLTILLSYGLPMGTRGSTLLAAARAILVDGFWGIGVGAILPRIGPRIRRAT